MFCPLQQSLNTLCLRRGTFAQMTQDEGAALCSFISSFEAQEYHAYGQVLWTYGYIPWTRESACISTP